MRVDNQTYRVKVRMYQGERTQWDQWDPSPGGTVNVRSDVSGDGGVGGRRYTCDGQGPCDEYRNQNNLTNKTLLFLV